MPQYTAAGIPLPNIYKAVAASATTSQVSTIGDKVKGRDYLERVIVTAASTLGGAVTIFDGAQALLVHNAQVTGYTGTNVYVYDVGCVAITTQGFNVTTGSSVSCILIGNF